MPCIYREREGGKRGGGGRGKREGEQREKRGRMGGGGEGEDRGRERERMTEGGDDVGKK